jgi:hypothetical protein
VRGDWHYAAGVPQTASHVEKHERPDFRQLLRDTRMSQVEFRSLVRRLTGREVSQTTTSRWAKNRRAAPPCAIALLVLIGRLTPEELDRLL